MRNTEAIEKGYGVYQAVLSPDECDALLASISVANGKGRAGVRNLFNVPAVRSIALDDRLLAVASQFLGGGPIPYKAILFDKSDRTNWMVVWHQDRVLPIEKPVSSPEWGPCRSKSGVTFAHAPTWALEKVVALRLHLDSSTTDNGPLQVVPGSHRLGVLDQHQVIDQANSSSFHTCTAERGGIVAIRPLLIHSSSKSVSALPRRVLHIEYAETLQLSADVRLALS